MFYYKYREFNIITEYPYTELETAREEEVIASEFIYSLIALPRAKAKACFCATTKESIFLKEENIELLDSNAKNKSSNYPDWLLEKLENRKIKVLNTEYPNWKDNLDLSINKTWKINIIGLGDVGTILLTGLQLLGGESISEIGIYDLDENKMQRMLFEGNQIYAGFNEMKFPKVVKIEKEDLFKCDMFVFCVTAGVPPVGSNSGDVRMQQFEGNKKIINIYAKQARANHFKGIFAVVSDPVDQLCLEVLQASNIGEEGLWDGLGLYPEQVKGFGLGVMNARAVYYSKQNNLAPEYECNGRAFGPHGEGLVIANDIFNYDENVSIELTKAATNANLQVRAFGFKPYIAPALSSGSLSILAAIKGEWHYSSTFIGGAFVGAKNRLNKTGIELEAINMPLSLKVRIQQTYERLCNQ
jgi:hypothetical protein